VLRRAGPESEAVADSGTTGMRIADVRLRPLSVPIATTYLTALEAGETDASQPRTWNHLVIEVETDDGLVGYGVCCAGPRWPRGLNGPAVAEIIEHEYRPLLLGRDPRLLGAIIPLLERAAADVPFAIAPIDLALWDLAGKAQGRPVYDLLGGRVRDSVPLHFSIGIKPVEEVASEVQAAMEKGYVDFKQKVGGPDFEAELAAVRTIREIAGERARILVDANQAWSAEVAVRRIRALDEYGLEFVEQPVPRWDLEGMRHVRRATGVPILADESCSTPADVARIASMGAADVVNIKLMKCGGLWNARKMAAVAEAGGLSCFVGCMGAETEVALAAGFHFALSHANVRYPTGILNVFTEQPVAEPPWEIRGTEAHPKQEVVGLGVDPKPEAIARFDASR
jgi:L-alanine-DL-glutamate epimerase-like enolase superfamily enzyme